MAGTDRSHLKRRTSFITLVVFSIAIGIFIFIALRPDILHFGSSRLDSQIVILPAQAAAEGGQWRLVSQWQNPGDISERHFYLIEFKNIPGWVSPSPVILRQDKTDVVIEGQYTPIEYSERTILSLDGSSTMAHRLIPELATAYLESIGADEVRKQAGSTADESIVQGIFYASKEIQTIRIKGQGTSAGLAAFMANDCDIAMASYPFWGHRDKFLHSPWEGAKEKFIIGMDAVAVIVSASNAVKTLTKDEVKKIFSGQIDNWNQVGGPDTPIHVFALASDFGTRLFFQDVFMDGAELVTTANIVDSHESLSGYIAQDSLAIGFSSVALANQCREVSIQQTNESEVFLPSSENIRQRRYLGFRLLYLYLNPKPSSQYAQDFIRFSQSALGQKLVEKFGFVSKDSDDETALNKDEPSVMSDKNTEQSITLVQNSTFDQDLGEEVSDNATGEDRDTDLTSETDFTIVEEPIVPLQNSTDSDETKEKYQVIEEVDKLNDGQVFVRSESRVEYNASEVLPVLIQPDEEKVPESLRRKVYQEYQEGIEGAVHLSTVFRFKLGSVELDQESSDNIRKVVAFFKQQENQSKQPIVVGFSDTAGDYSGNLSISRVRAQKVASVLQAQGLDHVLVLAAGEEDPEEPNDTRAGREKNRRVEVWMK
jgi:phosphate transport system substrate-binding protein